MSRNQESYYKPYLSDSEESDDDTKSTLSSDSDVSLPFDYTNLGAINLNSEEKQIILRDQYTRTSGVPYSIYNLKDDKTENSGTKFDIQPSTYSSILIINSKDRDRTAYPQPTFLTIRLPRTYRNVVGFQLTQMKLISSFFYFRNDKQNTFIKILEQGRTIVENGVTVPNIITTVLREGTYDINGILNELQTELNYTPPFFYFPNGFSDFITQFTASGNLGVNFNEPGDTFYSSLRKVFVPNPTKSQIVSTYFSSQNAGLTSYTLSQVKVAYYYPVLYEMLLDPDYENTVNLTLTASTRYLLSQETVRSRIIYTFQGLNDPVILEVINNNLAITGVLPNSSILDDYRTYYTFLYSLVNEYSCSYETNNNRIIISSSNLNTSLTTLLNNQTAIAIANELNAYGLSTAEYTGISSGNTYFTAVVSDMYNYLQEKLAIYFAINFGTYSAKFYANVSNSIFVQNGIGAVGVSSNYSLAVLQAGIDPIDTSFATYSNSPVYWPQLVASNAADISKNIVFIGAGLSKRRQYTNITNTIEISADVLNTVYNANSDQVLVGQQLIDNSGNIYINPTFKAGDCVTPIYAGKYTVFRFRSFIRQTLQVETLPLPYFYNYNEVNSRVYSGNPSIAEYFDMSYSYINSPLLTQPSALLTQLGRTTITVPYGTIYSDAVANSLNTYTELTVRSPVQYYSFVAPQPPATTPIANAYKYPVTIGLIGADSGKFNDSLNVYLYQDQGAYFAGISGYRNENPYFYKTFIQATPGASNVSFVQNVYAGTTYYIIVRSTELSFKNTSFYVSYWFIPPTPISYFTYDYTITPISVVPTLSFPVINGTTYNKLYSDRYDIDFIRLPVSSNLQGLDPGSTRFNKFKETSEVYIGYDINGISTDLTDYRGWKAPTSNENYLGNNPTTLFRVDPITQYTFQNLNGYSSSTSNYIYPGTSNAILAPPINTPYTPNTDGFTARQYKIVHWYDTHYVAPQVNEPLIPNSNFIAVASVFDASYGNLSGYNYNASNYSAAGSNLAFDNGIIGIGFLPGDGVWNIDQFVFKSAYYENSNQLSNYTDPNKSIQYIGVYQSGYMSSTKVRDILLTDAIYILEKSSNSPRVYDTPRAYNAAEPALLNGFDTVGGSYHYFVPNTTIKTTNPTSISGFVPSQTYFFNSNSYFVCIPFSSTGKVLTYYTLMGSYVPYPSVSIPSVASSYSNISLVDQRQIYVPNLLDGASITTASNYSGTIAYTTSTSHGLVSGSTVSLTGLSTTGFNLSGVATVTGSNTFTITSVNTGATVTGGNGKIAVSPLFTMPSKSTITSASNDPNFSGRVYYTTAGAHNLVTGYTIAISNLSNVTITSSNTSNYKISLFNLTGVVTKTASNIFYIAQTVTGLTINGTGKGIFTVLSLFTTPTNYVLNPTMFPSDANVNQSFYEQSVPIQTSLLYSQKGADPLTLTNGLYYYTLSNQIMCMAKGSYIFTLNSVDLTQTSNGLYLYVTNETTTPVTFNTVTLSQRTVSNLYNPNASIYGWGNTFIPSVLSNGGATPLVPQGLAVTQNNSGTTDLDGIYGLFDGGSPITVGSRYALQFVIANMIFGGGTLSNVPISTTPILLSNVLSNGTILSSTPPLTGSNAFRHFNYTKFHYTDTNIAIFQFALSNNHPTTQSWPSGGSSYFCIYNGNTSNVTNFNALSNTNQTFFGYSGGYYWDVSPESDQRAYYFNLQNKFLDWTADRLGNIYVLGQSNLITMFPVSSTGTLSYTAVRTIQPQTISIPIQLKSTLHIGTYFASQIRVDATSNLYIQQRIPQGSDFRSVSTVGGTSYVVPPYALLNATDQTNNGSLAGTPSYYFNMPGKYVVIRDTGVADQTKSINFTVNNQQMTIPGSNQTIGDYSNVTSAAIMSDMFISYSKKSNLIANSPQLFFQAAQTQFYQPNFKTLSGSQNFKTRIELTIPNPGSIAAPPYSAIQGQWVLTLICTSRGYQEVQIEGDDGPYSDSDSDVSGIDDPVSSLAEFKEQHTVTAPPASTDTVKRWVTIPGSWDQNTINAFLSNPANELDLNGYYYSVTISYTFPTISIDLRLPILPRGSPLTTYTVRISVAQYINGSDGSFHYFLVNGTDTDADVIYGYGVQTLSDLSILATPIPATVLLSAPVWGNSQVGNDTINQANPIWQVMYPTVKIVLHKQANTSTPITNTIDLSNYPSYPHTAMFYYDNFTAMSNDLFGKFGQETSKNFKFYDISSGYNFYSYIPDIILEPYKGNTSNPTPDVGYSYLAIRGVSPTENFKCLTRFYIPARYDFGFIPLVDISNETVTVLQNSNALYNQTYFNVLQSFNNSFIGSKAFGSNGIAGFPGSNYTFKGFGDFITQYAGIYNTGTSNSQLLSAITSNTLTTVSRYIRVNLSGILPNYVLNRTRFTDPLLFSILFKSGLNPEYATLKDEWGLGWNLGFTKEDTSYTTIQRASSFFKILDDFIYLKMNQELTMNRMDSSAPEDHSITTDATGQTNQYAAKLLLANFGSFAQTMIQNTISFNPPVSSIDRLTFQWVDANNIQINNADCDWNAVVQITEQVMQASAASTLPKI